MSGSSLERQIEYNMAIAEEGIRGKWGAEVGKTYLAAYGSESTFIKGKRHTRRQEVMQEWQDVVFRLSLFPGVEIRE